MDLLEPIMYPSKFIWGSLGVYQWITWNLSMDQSKSISESLKIYLGITGEVYRRISWSHVQKLNYKSILGFWKLGYPLFKFGTLGLISLSWDHLESILGFSKSYLLSREDISLDLLKSLDLSRSILRSLGVYLRIHWSLAWIWLSQGLWNLSKDRIDQNISLEISGTLKIFGLAMNIRERNGGKSRNSTKRKSRNSTERKSRNSTKRK